MTSYNTGSGSSDGSFFKALGVIAFVIFAFVFLTMLLGSCSSSDSTTTSSDVRVGDFAQPPAPSAGQTDQRPPSGEMTDAEWRDSVEQRLTALETWAEGMQVWRESVDVLLDLLNRRVTLSEIRLDKLDLDMASLTDRVQMLEEIVASLLDYLSKNPVGKFFEGDKPWKNLEGWLPSGQ